MSGNKHDNSVRQGRSNNEFEELLRQLKKLENFRSGILSSSEPEPSPILNQYSASIDGNEIDIKQKFNDCVQKIGDTASSVDSRIEATCNLWHIVRTMRKSADSLPELLEKYACTSMQLATKRFNDPVTEELLNTMRANFQVESQGSKFSKRG